MNLKDRNLRFALLKAVADAINEELAGERADHLVDLRERYDESGVKSFDVKLPDGTKVAGISLSIPKAATEVTDEEVFTQWCRDNFPTAITEHVIPAQPAVVLPATPERTVYVVDPKLTATLLKDAKIVDGVPFTKDGLLIEGVEHKPAGDPKSFSVRYETDGRDALAVAYRAGELDHLVAGSTLPALDSGGVVALPWKSADDEPIELTLDEKAETVTFANPRVWIDGEEVTGVVAMSVSPVDDEGDYEWPEVGAFGD